MKIAVEGCAHGELDTIYKTVANLEKENDIKIDLLIICGDFQSVRKPADLDCMSVPPKYRKLNTFYKYYSGVKKAPVLTIFIGGNHEASNFLSELPYGGWVCPNIYYLGYANVINIGGVRIGGVSGIYDARNYLRGHFECPPYDNSSKKSVYHVRNLEVFRLKQVKKPIDIFISHDWPTGVYNYGNKENLLRWKPFFKAEMSNNSLGSPPAEELLKELKPSYWFSAHLHCKFSALVPHKNANRTFTKFFALDKCLPHREFLQVIDIESSTGPFHIEYDTEWLSVLQLTDHLLSITRKNNFMPGKGYSERYDFTPTDKEMQCTAGLFNGDFKVPYNFYVTAPAYDPSKQGSRDIKLRVFANPQTERLCKLLNITDPLLTVLNKSNMSLTISEFSSTDFSQSFSTISSSNPDEVHLVENDLTDEVKTSTTDLDVSECNDFFIDRVGSIDRQNTNSHACSTPKPFVDLSVNGNSTMNNYNQRQSFNSPPVAHHSRSQLKISQKMNFENYRFMPYTRNTVFNNHANIHGVHNSPSFSPVSKGVHRSFNSSNSSLEQWHVHSNQSYNSNSSSSSYFGDVSSLSPYSSPHRNNGSPHYSQNRNLHFQGK